MAATRSLCIAMHRLYYVPESKHKGGSFLVPVSSTFVIRRGVKTNRVTERSTLRRRARATERG